MTHEWADRLSEYLDGELNARERAGVEAHVKGCAECARTLAELGAVVARAGRLPERAPEADLWPGIERRLAPRGRVIDLRALLSGGRRVSVPVPQLLAAALVLMLLSAGAVWLALERRTTLRAVPGLEPAANAALGASDTAAPEAAGVVAADFGFSRYDAAIADLERTLEQHRGQLDPATVRVVELNLRLIDRAIAQARRALESDPANPYLNNHLADQMRLKVDVLRQVTALIHA